jgi:hypothetical protein
MPETGLSTAKVSTAAANKRNCMLCITIFMQRTSAVGKHLKHFLYVAIFHHASCSCLMKFNISFNTTGQDSAESQANYTIATHHGKMTSGKQR